MPTRFHNIFQLVFGDMQEDSDILDDRVISNNGDRNKVLETVVEIVNMYTQEYPHRWVYVQGSTSVRTRLYKMIIVRNPRELSIHFEIYGIMHDGTLNKNVNDGEPCAFILKQKY